MSAKRRAKLEKWITLAQAAPIAGIDGSNVGKRARRGEFGKTRLFGPRGVRQITRAGLAAWKAGRK